MDEVKLLPCDPTPEMASAGMHIIAALPGDSGWPELARAACDVYRAMTKVAPASTIVTDEVVERLREALKPFAIEPDAEGSYDITEMGPKQFDAARAAIASMPTIDQDGEKP